MRSACAVNSRSTGVVAFSSILVDLDTTFNGRSSDLTCVKLRWTSNCDLDEEVVPYWKMWTEFIFPNLSGFFTRFRFCRMLFDSCWIELIRTDFLRGMSPMHVNEASCVSLVWSMMLWPRDLTQNEAANADKTTGNWWRGICANCEWQCWSPRAFVGKICRPETSLPSAPTFSQYKTKFGSN